MTKIIGPTFRTQVRLLLCSKWRYTLTYPQSLLAKDMIDRLLTFEPAKRITAEEALQHPWIASDKEKGPRTSMNLAPNVRRGFNSRQSLRSVVTAMTLLHHWKHLEDVSEDEDDSETENNNGEVRELDVSQKGD